MSNFWPSSIDLGDTQSPMEILNDAQKEWDSESNGQLTLVLQTTESESGNDLIYVHAKHVPKNRTITIFSVVHRPKSPYPVTIFPEDKNLPNFLKKSYYIPGTKPLPFGASMALQLGQLETKGRDVVNEWVCETPFEFRRKLGEVFNLGFVKSAILNLVSGESEVDENAVATDEPAADDE